MGASPYEADGAKRRRLNISQPEPEIPDDSECDTASSSCSESHQDPGDQDHGKDERANEKPKSKYRIHIPKNGELPGDAFFTQLPERTSSPSLIQEFHWQKPRRPSPPSTSSVPPPASRNPAVSTTSATFNGVEASQATAVTHSLPPEVHEKDEFDLDEDYEEMLAILPPDAFTKPPLKSDTASDGAITLSSQQDYGSQVPHGRLTAPQNNLRQTTLFGTQAQDIGLQTQSKRKHNWPLANRDEPPTHHKLDREAMKTWVYPTNLGTIREYQFSITARALYHNLLVALPTGLGKTFIAATVMLNWFRWTVDAQIVFVAPTKPLVSQQVKACFELAGIPRSTTTMLTGVTAPGLRAEEWRTKRVFFMTPQTMINDLKTGICEPKRLVLLVVDEAHRATGAYSYVEIVNFVKRFNTSFRVLALTATPGSSIENVQEVIDGLSISRIEIRTEQSLDIRQYVHPRKIETVLFEDSEEMTMVMDLFAKTLQPLVDKLAGLNAYWSRDPMSLTPYSCTLAIKKWMASNAGKNTNFAIKGMVQTIFALLASLSHAIELLKFHGIGPFYQKVLAFRDEMHANGKKGGKYAKQVNDNPHFQKMMSRVQLWINSPDFVGHPKLGFLRQTALNHFMDAGEGKGISGPSGTRIMIFAHYRDSAEDIARFLKRDEPMLRPHVFVGQTSSKGSEGMDQKKQLNVIEQFKNGIHNILVATCVGEEGLDIGEVDLIVCYDASASPIRMLQRMGRTGRKRAGKIIVTLMKGKEENNFTKAKDNYEKMQMEIASGARFTFRDEESRRILPKDAEPVVDKRVIDIPPENTQADLPEPRKRGRPPKRPPKKFHMPDGVRQGFVKASRLGGNDESDGTDTSERTPRKRIPAPILAPVPSLEDVLLTPAEERVFERTYLYIKGDESQTVEHPRVDAHPDLQRTLRPTKHIGHGRFTKNIVGALSAIHALGAGASDRYEQHLTTRDRNAGLVQAEKRAHYLRSPRQASTPSRAFGAHSSIPSKTPSARNTQKHPKTPRLPKAPRTTATASIGHEDDEEDLADDDSLNDFIDDNNMNVTLNNVASSTSSPPPPSAPHRLFYEENNKVLNMVSDSDDSLPDFDTLVGGQGQGKRKAGKEPGGQGTRKREGRRVVSDSEEE